MEPNTNDYMKSAIEAILFVSEKPVLLDQIREALEAVQPAEIQAMIRQLQKEYEDNDRGMIITEIAGGYQMLSSPSYASIIRNFFKKRVKEKLSRPALETLAIIAYKQPVSRGDIELIRGVNSDGVMTHLLSKGLIKIVGRKEIAGRPYIYGTTKQFLEYFGLKSLRDLPKLQDFPAMVEQTQKDLPEAKGGEETPTMSIAEAEESAGKEMDQIEDADSHQENVESAQESPEQNQEQATTASETANHDH